tara:strand:+ start:429 stop:1076 length:648 start_codon:yes stop_codon:yes gene_type:complete
MKKENKYYLKTLIALTFVALHFTPLIAQVGAQKKLINPNFADAESLQSVKHFTKESADLLIRERPYLSLEKLHKHLTSEFNADQVKEILSELCVKLNINKADQKSLLLIPNLGPKMAHEVDEYRPYVSFKQFRKEIGKYVSKKEVERLELYFFIPIELNEASDEEILSIPGVGKKLLHEFKEYRPYKSLKQFRKEIGKYVNEMEIKRLERYVTLK